VAEIFVGSKNFVTENLPEDGTLVPKYVGIDTCYELCFMIYYFIFYLVCIVGFLNI